MRSVQLLAALVALGFVALLPLPAQRAQAGPNCSASSAIDSEEEAFLDLINGYRQRNGLGPLALSDSLNHAAAWKSTHMANNDYFSHDDAVINRSFVDRLRACGYTANTWLAENIAAGNDTARETFEQWRNSPGHNSNMLNPNMVVIGVARAFDAGSTYGWYWTTEFGGEADGPPPAPPPASEPAHSGDANCTGRTDSIDAALVLQFSAELVRSLPCAPDADVDGDTRIGSIDAALILQITAGLLA